MSIQIYCRYVIELTFIVETFLHRYKLNDPRVTESQMLSRGTCEFDKKRVNRRNSPLARGH